MRTTKEDTINAVRLDYKFYLEDPQFNIEFFVEADSVNFLVKLVLATKSGFEGVHQNKFTRAQERSKVAHSNLVRIENHNSSETMYYFRIPYFRTLTEEELRNMKKLN